MLNAFKSESKVVEVILKDAAGTVIDPTLTTISDIEVIIQSKLDGSVIGKFSRELKTGWTQCTTTSEHLICNVPTFEDATKGLVEAQVNIIIPDVSMPTGLMVHTQKGIILSVTEAYTE